ncbi:MAG TPA: YceI family protein [Saprospiraceae bacterium]|jgi:polyisoprenoid-binding protein YceI|nr:YceI family protein [Saprospiraceae bacterium]HMT70229.1 YceI family protein [Saprospiraceae bacterium]
MRKFIIGFFLVFLGVQVMSAQKYFTKTGHISFYSDTPLEKIEGHNKSSNCVLDVATGKLEVATLVKGFQFEKALMQEHFNENYMESDKFPKAVFKGQIDNYSKLDISKNGKVTVKVSGDLTMHGVTKKVTTDAVVSINNGKIIADASFNVLLADFNIKIPALVKDQIAKSLKIKVACTLEPLK